MTGWKPAPLLPIRLVVVTRCALRPLVNNFHLPPVSLLLHGLRMEALSTDEIKRAVQSALAEDLGSGDVTTQATVPENAVARAHMVARE